MDSGIRTDIQEKEDCFEITVNTKAYVMYVYLDLEEDDCHFSDNFFNLSSGSKTVVVKKDSMSKALSLDEFKNQLFVRTVTDIGK